MKAVLLAGGYGKRLKPLTETTPKPLLEVSGKPILVWQIEWLKKLGVREFIVCAGYLREKIIEALGSGGRLGVKVGYSVEDEPLGTGGALKNAEHLLK
ncbi:MAG: nucleotidyltransferase family protein, partial [Candidatus Caldarchaeum sp.]